MSTYQDRLWSPLMVRLKSAGTSEQTIPEGTTLRVVFGRIFAVEAGEAAASDDI